MAKASWELDQLKRALSARKEIKGWIITQENVRRRERYFMAENSTLITDQDRDVQVQTLWARIFVRLANKDRQGEIAKKLFKNLPLDAQIDSAIHSALQTDLQAWEIPQQLQREARTLQTTDPRVSEDIERALSELTRKISAVVAKPRAAQFNSAELFLSVHDRELHLSNGLTERSSQSRIYTEAAWSFSQKSGDEVRSDEFLNMRWAVNMDDLGVDEVFERAAEHAEHSLDVAKPAPGKYPVLVDAAVLAELFNGHLSQLSSANAYHGLPFVKPGDELIPGAQGDLITLTLDPWLEFGADSTLISDQGVAQAPLKLVERNRVLTSATEKQYADYLGKPATTSRGNIVIDPGTASYEELLRHAPQVLEIIQFSALFADPNSGTFSSEIRLAKLHDNEKGTVQWIKGGSLSGSITENLTQARFSSRRVKRAQFSANQSGGHGYYGPSHALMNDVSVVG